MSTDTTGAVAAPLSPIEVMKKAGGSALRGGVAGATAQVANVGALMWMRTIMNYQYRYGGDFTTVTKRLYNEGGVPRFYRGLIPALMQAPLSRFGDTASNVGMLALLDSSDSTRNLPIAVKTAAGSTAAALFRVFLMPIDAWKTTKQVEGEAGLKLLIQKVRTHGISKLWHGSVGAMTATWVGNFPWFFMHNLLSSKLPQLEIQNGKTVRNAFIGFCSSVVSDTISNSLRVVKTTRQTSVEPVTYMQAAKNVVAKDGYVGLFGRGLKTRIVTNGLQGAVFSVAWKSIQGFLDKRAEVKSSE
jgi:hypothetical protein